MNILTIDLEDWFQVSNLEKRVPREAWPNCEFRLMRNTERMLQMLDDAGAKATFFVLGWNAKRCPSLIRQIVQAGHEIATHGWEHRLIYDMNPDEFREDLRRSICAIEDAAGIRVYGHRAASFSITEDCLWALDVLVKEGITYDSSMFPIRHDRYGVSRQWQEVRDVITDAGSIVEVPITVWPTMGANVPFAGGGYFRLWPYGIVRSITRAVNRAGKRVVFYFHPWEIDEGIPKVKLGLATGLRSYVNIDSNARKLSALLGDFKFMPMRDAIRHYNLPVRTLRYSSDKRWLLV